MIRRNIRHIILFLILLLASCGVKREVVSQPEQDGMVDKTVVSVASEDVALSLEQRIAAGEFAWLDTIVIDAEKIDLRVQGSYKLDRWVGEEDLYKNNPSVFTFFIDSIVFIHKGCYYKAYKEGILADYGRFITRKFSEEQVCLGDSLQRFYNVQGLLTILDFYSCKRKSYQYIAMVGYPIAIEIWFLYKRTCEENPISEDFCHAVWITADQTKVDYLKEMRHEFDSKVKIDRDVQW